MLRSLLQRFWAEQHGSTSAEWAFIATILVLGAITGVVLSRHAELKAHEELPTQIARW